MRRSLPLLVAALLLAAQPRAFGLCPFPRLALLVRGYRSVHFDPPAPKAPYIVLGLWHEMSLSEKFRHMISGKTPYVKHIEPNSRTYRFEKIVAAKLAKQGCTANCVTNYEAPDFGKVYRKDFPLETLQLQVDGHDAPFAVPAVFPEMDIAKVKADLQASFNSAIARSPPSHRPILYDLDGFDIEKAFGKAALQERERIVSAAKKAGLEELGRMKKGYAGRKVKYIVRKTYPYGAVTQTVSPEQFETKLLELIEATRPNGYAASEVSMILHNPKYFSHTRWFRNGRELTASEVGDLFRPYFPDLPQLADPRASNTQNH